MSNLLQQPQPQSHHAAAGEDANKKKGAAMMMVGRESEQSVYCRRLLTEAMDLRRRLEESNRDILMIMDRVRSMLS